ncbi:DUF6801 domain-containing protein [Actinomadura yumaensis]|uniref:DUF6801 domain-containing protein n=1 Tax=Actinomadura yumaensis TaxID=111807 RepID=UPI00360FD357
MALAASVPLLVGGQLALTGSSAPAAAEQSSLTLLYRCKFPVIMEQDLKLTIKVDVPKKIPVGASVQKFPIEAVATVNAETTDGLTAVEAATIEGTSDPRTRLFTPDRPKGSACGWTPRCRRPRSRPSARSTFTRAARPPRSSSPPKPGPAGWRSGI